MHEISNSKIKRNSGRESLQYHDFFRSFSVSFFVYRLYILYLKMAHMNAEHTHQQLNHTDNTKNYEVYQCLLFLCALFIVSRLIPLYVFGV